jgi:peptidoglycan/LPS O-acetylase OafA/YrhL
MDINMNKRQLVARGLFLAAALLSFGLSVVLYFTGNDNEGIFVGLWVPSILALGAFLAPRGTPGPAIGPQWRRDE